MLEGTKHVSMTVSESVTMSSLRIIAVSSLLRRCSKAPERALPAQADMPCGRRLLAQPSQLFRFSPTPACSCTKLGGRSGPALEGALNCFERLCGSSKSAHLQGGGPV